MENTIRQTLQGHVGAFFSLAPFPFFFFSDAMPPWTIYLDATVGGECLWLGREDEKQVDVKRTRRAFAAVGGG